MIGLILSLIGLIILAIAFPWMFYIVILIIPWLAILILYFLFKRDRLSKRAGMYEIDNMTAEQFELFLKDVFIKRGYEVRHVGRHYTGAYVEGDYGADLIISKDGKKTAVQVKHYSGKVGLNAVREALGAVNYYKCDKAAVITNSREFTQQAKELAKVNNVKLWDRNDLIKVLLKLNPQQ